MLFQAVPIYLILADLSVIVEADRVGCDRGIPASLMAFLAGPVLHQFGIVQCCCDVYTYGLGRFNVS